MLAARLGNRVQAVMLSLREIASISCCDWNHKVPAKELRKEVQSQRSEQPCPCPSRCRRQLLNKFLLSTSCSCPCDTHTRVLTSQQLSDPPWKNSQTTQNTTAQSSLEMVWVLHGQQRH